MRATVIKFRRAALGSFVAVACAGPSLAQAPAPRFDVRLLPSGAVLGATAALGLAPILLAGRLPHTTCAPCDPASLPPIDRGTVGAVRPGWGTLSNVAEFAVVGSAGFLLAREAHGDWGVAGENLTVFAQAIGTATLLDNWVKILVARPRPARYLASAAGTSTSAATGLSFPSGHTTGAMAAAFAYWSIQSRRGTAGARSGGVAALITAAAVVGVLRVVAREHFPTDVMAGALLGAVIGWEVPQHYPLQRPPSPP
jgi:membrane-associated phospholipid phosphatase